MRTFVPSVVPKDDDDDDGGIHPRDPPHDPEENGRRRIASHHRQCSAFGFLLAVQRRGYRSTSEWDTVLRHRCFASSNPGRKNDFVYNKLQTVFHSFSRASWRSC